MIPIVQGNGTPWEPFFRALEPDTEVLVMIAGRVPVSGSYDGPATWSNRAGTVEFNGLVVASDEGIHTWIPYDVVVGVELP